MKNPIFFILCMLLLTCACTNTSEKANDAREITTPLDSPNIDSLFRQTMEIEAHKADYDQIRATIKAANWEDSTRLQLFLAKQKPKMLTFTTFDDAGEPAGEGVYYFDQTAFPFAEKISGGDGAFYSVFFKYGGFVPFSNINSILKLQESNNFARNYRRALSAKEINVFMQKFPTIKYENISFNQDSTFLLKTLSNLRLRTAPSILSNTIVVIPKDSLVQFLAATTLADTVETMSWIWYKVKMQKSNQIGWVFGHPKYLMVVDDEHY